MDSNVLASTLRTYKNCQNIGPFDRHFPVEHGDTPIYWAAKNGHTEIEIVEILAPFDSQS